MTHPTTCPECNGLRGEHRQLDRDSAASVWVDCLVCQGEGTMITLRPVPARLALKAAYAEVIRGQ